MTSTFTLYVTHEGLANKIPDLPTHQQTLVRFWVFLLGEGSPKTPLNYFLQKVHVENFFQQIDKKPMSVVPQLFCFIAFSGVSQRWEFKNTTKMFYKKSCRKVFTKKLKKNHLKIPNRFFLECFYHVFGRFSMRGVQKHDKKIYTQIWTLVLFWPLTYPPTTGVTDFVFCRPLGLGPTPGLKQREDLACIIYVQIADRLLDLRLRLYFLCGAAPRTPVPNRAR
jgi:hypothetical protein